MVSTRYWVWLQCCIHQGSALICDILDVYGDPQRFYEAVSSCDPDAGLKELTSITNSQIDLISVVKTKTTLFPYYKALYEQLGLYEKYRAQIFKYLIATASRG